MRLVYLSPVALTSYAQRPHHFVEWFHQRFAAPVLWIDPGPTRLPRIADVPTLWRPKPPNLGPPWSTQNWLQTLSCRGLPLEPLAWARAVNRWMWQSVLAAVDQFVTPDTWFVLAKPCALALELAKRYAQLPIVFDAMDYTPAFFHGLSRRWMCDAQAELAQRARYITVSSSALACHHDRYASKVSRVFNALTPPPLARAGGRAGAPVLGYVGTLGPWFDWPSVIHLASLLPTLEVRLIGPRLQSAVGRLPTNVRLLAPIAQHQVYAAMQQFSVGLIPFVHSEVTRYVDPVKFYEYRALGLPVLSTRFGEMAQRGTADSVFFLEDLLCGKICLQDITETRTSGAETNAFCAANCWHSRFDAISFFQDCVASDQTPGSIQ